MSEFENEFRDLSSIPTEELRERVRIFLEAVDVLLTELKTRREASEPDPADLPSVPIVDVSDLPNI